MIMGDRALKSRCLGKPLVLDGGFGQLLKDQHPEIDMSDGLWASGAAVRYPDVIKEIHLEYLRAHCDIISSATYQASLEGYVSARLATDKSSATRLMAATLELTVDARAQYLQEIASDAALSHMPLIAAALGSIGATLGDCSEYTGRFGKSLTGKNIYEFHKQRLLMLHECLKTEKLVNQINLVAIETIPSIQEAMSVMDALHYLNKQGVVLPEVWISFSASTEECIGSGESIIDAVKLVNSCPEVSAVGVNCVSADIVNGLLKRIKQATSKPVVCYPNGQTWQGTQDLWDRGCGKIKPKQFARKALDWIKTGANIVGGCCKTTPEHIKSIFEEVLREYHQS